MRYFKLREVCERLEISDELLATLTSEGLVEIKHSSSDEAVLSASEAEKLRVITILMREMDVNLPGVEVILHMREDLFSAHSQLDEILHALVAELQRRLRA
jgi:MerR family transcriptional regulator, heat shock protein HspR